MFYVVAVVVVAAVAIVFVASRRRGKRTPVSDCHIHLCIPFRTQPRFDPQNLAKRFRETWQLEAVCGEACEFGPGDRRTTTYLFGNGTHSLRISVSRAPLAANLVEVTAQGRPDLPDTDKAALESHKGYIFVDYLFGPDQLVACAEFAAKLLLVLLQDPDALGYADISAMAYRTRDEVESFLGQSALEPAGLFLLLANTHLVESDDHTWVHTHGMEQFGCPDLEARFQEKDKHRYYWELVSYASVYMIERGPILKPGDTAELTGDGVIFRITAGKPDPDHPFGSRGSVVVERT